MSKQRSWCCGFIPGFWWWFLVLLGLPSLFLLMTYFTQGVVEEDLTQRVSAALTADNVDWVEVDVRHRGRDVVLRGIPPDEDARARAVSTAAAIYGVHRVDFESDVLQVNAAKAESSVVLPALSLTATADGQLTLEGSLPSQLDIDNVLQAAAERFGLENIDDQLSVGPGVATPEWLAAPDELLNILPDKAASLNIADGNVEIATEVNSDNMREDMLVRIKRLLGGEVIDNIVVKPLPSPEVALDLVNGQLTLAGKVSSATQRERLLQMARARFGAENVTPQLEVDQGVADAVWLATTEQVMGLLGDKGSAIIANDTLELQVDVDSEAARQTLAANSAAVLEGSGLLLVNAISVVSPAVSATVNANAQAAPQTEATTIAAPSVQACQERLNAAVRDQQVLFQVNQADIRSASYGLLDELAGIITACQTVLSAAKIHIGGHTDSDGSKSYNLNLSQRRAAAVRTYLVTKGVAAEQMLAEGFGEEQPVASNSTAAGKAQNRRISFEIKAAE